MTPKRQKIYIAIIVVCFSTTGVILYRTLFPSVQTTAIDHPNITTGEVPIAENVEQFTTSPVGSDGKFSAPRVFPDSTKFDWAVMDSLKFQESVPVSGIILSPGDLSRDNPFAPY